MKQLTWDSNSYRMDGEPVFLVSGEFHYFRVPRSDWETRLRYFQQAGGNCVATYIPWILHEPTEGDIRFGDTPQRDLEGFLELCKKLEIHVIVRPGPYQYSELKYDGLPGWLCDYYPEILARDVHGNIMRASSASYLHPTFVKKARIWYEAVCPILARYTQENGGTIAFAQFDNEMIGIHEWFGGWDYNTDTMGFGREDGRYASFLRKRYGDIALLNETYRTTYLSFGMVEPFAGNTNNDYERRRLKDYQEFYFSTVADYAVLLTNWFDELGVRCSYMHNAANPGMNAYFLELVERLGNRFVLGSDHYYNLNQDWDQNNPTPQYASKVLYSNESLRLLGYPATVCELPGGSASEWPPVTASDLRCCYLTNTALGMKGSNYYIFTGGPNPDGLGANGDSYDYNASIGANGQIRPAYHVQKEWGQFLQEHSWLAAAWHESDFYLGLDWDQSRSEHYHNGADSRGLSSYDAWRFSRKGIATSGLCASYAPEYLDLRQPLPIDEKPLFVTTSVGMRRSIQENLVDYVQKGGKLVLAPCIPTMDECFRPCTVLQDFLGGASEEACREGFPTVTVGGIRNIQTEALYRCTIQPSGAVSLGVEENSKSQVAWRKDFPEGGSVIWLGLRWSHAKSTHLELMRYLCGKEPAVRCDNPNIWTILRTDGTQRMLFVLNLFTSEMPVSLQVWENGGYRDLGTRTIPAMSVHTELL